MKKDFYSNIDIEKLEGDKEKLRRALLLTLNVKTKEELNMVINLTISMEKTEKRLVCLIIAQTLLETWD